MGRDEAPAVGVKTSAGACNGVGSLSGLSGVGVQTSGGATVSPGDRHSKAC